MKALIVAIDEDGGIGKDGDIPWHYKKDMQYFSKTTRGATCIMGRKTYLDIFNSIGNKERLLPKRESIVITSLQQEEVHGAIAVKSFEEALSAVSEESDVFFIGGESIYNNCLEFIDRMYITEIPDTHDCDVNVPSVIEYMEEYFELIYTTPDDETGISFVVYDRR